MTSTQADHPDLPDDNGQKRVRLPDPDPDNITVLTHELPNEPILPWHQFDSPWLGETEAEVEPEAEVETAVETEEPVREEQSQEGSVLGEPVDESINGSEMDNSSKPSAPEAREEIDAVDMMVEQGNP